MECKDEDGNDENKEDSMIEEEGLLWPYLVQKDEGGRMRKDMNNKLGGNNVVNDLKSKGYAVIPSVVTCEECKVYGLDLIWDFVEDVSGNVVDRSNPHSWYNKCSEKIVDDDDDDEVGLDPWPHTGYASFPDMFQSLGAGFLLGHLRELMAERVYEPLFGTDELHCSKEGFTFHRPSTYSCRDMEGNVFTLQHPNNGQSEIRVCGEVQEDNMGEHYDQSFSERGLHSIQASIALIDQKEEAGDGHFLCYPYSHSQVHQDLTRDIYRGQFSWIPLTDQEIQTKLQHKHQLKPLHIYVNAGDVILWRSDLVHAAVAPTPHNHNFRAVAYISMSPASLTPSHLLDQKLNAYKFGKTGDHRSHFESWHSHKRSSSSTNNNHHHCNSKSNITVLQRQRPYFRMGPPQVSTRLAQLYGLLPYNLTPHQLQQKIQKATIRGVRFHNDTDYNKTHQNNNSYNKPKNKLLCEAKIKILTLEGGNAMTGQDKYLGGMASPCGRYVYGVPGNAQQVLRIDTQTNIMDVFGPKFVGKFKWLRGVEVPPNVMNDTDNFPSGCCLALPSNAPSVLKINPFNNTVTTFGDLSNQIHHGWLYHGGNLTSDGNVYAVPANATQVLKINPRDETIELIGPIFPGKQKWFGGILASDGCVYGIPQNASSVLKIDPINNCVSVLGEGLLQDGKWKWHGGIAINNGNKIIGYPNNADAVLVVDVPTQRVYTIGDSSVLKSGRHRIPQDGRYKYLGGESTQDGKYTYLFPCDAEQVLRIDNLTEEVLTVGPYLLEGENKYQNGFTGRDGCLYGVPQRASGVLCVIPPAADREEIIDMLYCGDDMVGCKDKFEGGVMGADDNIYCIPLRAKSLLKVVPGPSIS